jgi:ribonuclease P protein component
MIGAKYRIPKNDIPSVVRKGKRFQSDCFDIKVWYDNELEHSRFAIIVSTKIDKRAVVRNTIKRKFRSAIFSILSSHDNFFRKGNYAIIVRKVDIKNLSADDIEVLIRKILG